MTLNKRLVPALVVLILFIGLGTSFFIYNSNDHAECGTDVSLGRTEDGYSLKVVSHVCKEKFSF